MLAAALALTVLAAATADDAAKVREVDTKGLKLTQPERAGPATRPDVITSADELAKSPVLGAEKDAIGKKVDFAREKLVLFTWSGSGQDAVAPGAVTDTAAPFTYTRGKTKDLRSHLKLFVVPKGAEVKVGK